MENVPQETENAAANSGEPAAEEPADVPEEEMETQDDEEEGVKVSLGLGGALAAGATIGRAVTLQMLLSEGILQPGDGTMSIDYLGQKFRGDLLASGKIKSQETNKVFGSPSAWAIYCKKIVNPEKKSGCGWASVKYKGKKLDAYKSTYFKRRRLGISPSNNQNKENNSSDATPDDESDCEKDETQKSLLPPPPPPPTVFKVPFRRIVVKHNMLGNRSATHDANTLVESTPFSAIGKIQPFTVSITSSTMLVVDFHCHLTTSEVVGYLAGHWDVNAHNLCISYAFPCLCRLGDKTASARIEAEASRMVETKHLTVIGWYHSHPYSTATPSLRDIDAQLDHQIKMKGSSDASYTPCVGVICAPYNPDADGKDSSVMSYWVVPPPESRPQEYGRPMLMAYSVTKDQSLATDTLQQMKQCMDFYRDEVDCIPFDVSYRERITFADKIKAAMLRHCSQDLSQEQLTEHIHGFLTKTPPPEIASKEVHEEETVKKEEG